MQRRWKQPYAQLPARRAAWVWKWRVFEMSMSKRRKAIVEKLNADRVYPVEEACELLKSLPRAKFVESVDAAVNLGIDPRKSDQVVRGASALPHGRGKTVRVAV